MPRTSRKKGHPLLDRALPALQAAGAARARAMFGGWGIYLDDVIVAIIAWDRLFFRVDNGNRPDYQAAGSTPFTYEGRSGRQVEMPYWEVPEDVQAEPDRLCAWALKARAASVMVGRTKRPRRRKPA